MGKHPSGDLMNPIIFINQVRSKELQPRLKQLNQFKQELDKSPREPVVNKTRASKKYQPLVDDYNKLITEVNASRKAQSIMIELIIMLCFHVDYTSNPQLIDEFFANLPKEERST